MIDDGELARVRAIPLSGVLEGLGASRDPKDPKRNWRLGASRISVDDARWYDQNGAGATHRLRGGQGGAGAVDLLMYLRDLAFADAVRELGGWDPGAIATATRDAEVLRRTPAAHERPGPDPRHTATVHRYLTIERAIPARLVELAMASGQVFADQRANAVFRLTDTTGETIGYELRGTRAGSTFHGVRGEKGLFLPMRPDGVREAAFVESGIEALSYQALAPQRLVVSTTGSAVARPLAMARHLLARGYRLIAAFNADPAGDRMAVRLAEALGAPLERHRPERKDWNLVLQDRRGPRVTRPEPRAEDVLMR
ncbi:MAG: DUF3991 and toprim domain-containing protein [Myxococcota bacterium]|jgi:hypothetical protein|nr:DUF3991 and toprim domain-containing protein [Myxococcota bacterium]MCU0895965.1 DUF3991 and toprim domain-containing protein [Burkholderiales bacterium]